MTPDGFHVLYAAATTIPGRLALGGLAAAGESLLVVRGPDGVRRGIALGCKTLTVDGKPIHVPEADFEFDLVNGRLNATPVYRPVEPVQILPADTSAFVGQQKVTLTCTTPNTQIHYTLDGSNPTPASPLYRAPFTITNSTTVRASAFRDGVTTAPTTMSGTKASLATEAFFAVETPQKAVGTPATVPGLQYDYYEGPWQELLTRLDEMTPVRSGQVAKLFDESARGTAATFAFRYTGYLDVPADGVYRFYAPPEFYEPNIMAGYDLHLSIDGQDWYPATSRHALGIWSIALQKGKHTLMVTFSDLRGDAVRKMAQSKQQAWIWAGTVPDVEMAGPGMPKAPIPAGMLSHAG